MSRSGLNSPYPYRGAWRVKFLLPSTPAVKVSPQLPTGGCTSPPSGRAPPDRATIPRVAVFAPFFGFFCVLFFASHFDVIFLLFGAILPPFLLQNHGKSLPERASVSDVVPSPFFPDPGPISDMCEHRISCWGLQNNTSREKSPFLFRT